MKREDLGGALLKLVICVIQLEKLFFQVPLREAFHALKRVTWKGHEMERE
jgi:hypothetical protein